MSFLFFRKIHHKNMDLKINIKNLGKLTDADIRINKFTVFAGANNTGKSFASRALYSRLSSSLGDSYVLGELDDYAHDLREGIDNLRNEGFNDDSELSSLLQRIDELSEIISQIKSVDPRDKIVTLKKSLSVLLDTCKSIGVKGKTVADIFMVSGQEEQNFNYTVFRARVDLFRNMTEDKIRQIFTTDIEKMFEYNLLQNFQATKLSELANDKGKGISVKIGAKSLTLKQKEYVKDYLNDENYSSLDILDTFITGRVLYMGSPLFWQLKNPLESADGKKKSSGFERRLSGIPKYFNDMVRALKDEYIGDPISSDVLDRLTGEHGINGKVSVASTGDMIYAENNGVTVPLGRAAAGIANMGVLALLIEKNILDENTFLFISEPEAHVHPKWQVEMADALFKLAEAGVNVVVATHSDNILKWLEVHVNKNPKAKEIIALNHFSKEGVESIDTDRFDTGLAEIKIELTDPFADLHWEGLRHDIAR